MSPGPSRQTIAQVNVSAIKHNLVVLKNKAPAAKVMSVIKADAYGHGLSRVIPALAASDAFAVAVIDEAIVVRETGWAGPLVILEGVSNPQELAAAIELRAEIVVHHPSQVELLNGERRRLKQRLWLKLDSGMHRLGFPLEQSRHWHQALQVSTKEVALMTHFACADDKSNPMTLSQWDSFQRAAAGLPGPRSAANSAATLNFPQTHGDWIRPGLALYGISPCPDQVGADWGLQPAMKLSCQIIAVNHYKAGDSIGYQAAYRCPEDMPVGVAAMGYGDGYPWRAGMGAQVLLKGKKAPVIGRVSMDMISIDLRGLGEIEIGEEVLIWGKGLPVEEVAGQLGTIPYELVCGLSSRVRYQTVSISD